MNTYALILALHVFAGFTALLVGLVPMFTAKGSSRHVQSGKVYFWAMFGVFLTSSAMFFFKPDRLLFLFLIGIFSFYLTFTGSRAVRYKKRGSQVAPLDWAVAGVVSVAGLVMLGMGVWCFYKGSTGGGILYSVFGGICASNAIRDLFSFHRFQNNIGTHDPNAWLYQHISRMGGSYIATFTAFCVVNNFFLPNLVVWLAPAIIGGYLISRNIRKRRQEAMSR